MSETILCNVCPHGCRLRPGDIGACGARGYFPDGLGWNEKYDGSRALKNNSTLPINYGITTSLALDPIEKKPLARFNPGSRILSYGSFGCNLKCPFCQNYEISMQSAGDYGSTEREEAYVSPEELVKIALECQSKGNIGVAFTYNEPLICYEYVIDTARLLRTHGLKTVLVTNGCANGEIADQVLPWIDALNIDLKSFREDVYAKILKGSLETVKSFIEKAAKSCHVELTTLIVPGMNSDPKEMEEISRWIASLDGGADIPLHVSRFFPRYKMSGAEPTGIALVYELADVARRNLNYVYTGNC